MPCGVPRLKEAEFLLNLELNIYDLSKSNSSTQNMVTADPSQLNSVHIIIFYRDYPLISHMLLDFPVTSAHVTLHDPYASSSMT